MILAGQQFAKKEGKLDVELLIILHHKYFRENNMTILLIYGALEFLLTNFLLERLHFIIQEGKKRKKE